MADASRAAQIEVDTAVDYSDVGSSMDARISTYTASLSPSVVDYPMEHGRRYHAFRGGSYLLPNDELEMHRLDLTHALMTKILGNELYMAPIKMEQVHRILDIGTGTGIWAMQIGDENPNTFVLGNDLSPIQPDWVPPNVKFEVDDVESPWMHDCPFDFVFCRCMAASILDWPKLAKNVYDNLRPGGWAEFQDFDFLFYSEDGSLTEDHHTMIWINTLTSGTRSIGREPCPGPKLSDYAAGAGFANVTHHLFKVPIGPWAKDARLKDIGMCNLAQIFDGLEAFSLRLFCNVLKWSEQEVMVLLAKVRQELRTGKIHAQIDFHVVYGQKPGGY